MARNRYTTEQILGMLREAKVWRAGFRRQTKRPWFTLKYLLLTRYRHAQACDPLPLGGEREILGQAPFATQASAGPSLERDLMLAGNGTVKSRSARGTLGGVGKVITKNKVSEQ